MFLPVNQSLQADYGFSTKLGEYLATGRPVVSTKVGEIEKYLIDRKNAFLCEPNIISVAEAICCIIEDYDSALKIGQEGKRCALEFFNNKTETAKIINEIMESWPQKRLK